MYFVERIKMNRDFDDKPNWGNRILLILMFILLAIQIILSKYVPS